MGKERDWLQECFDGLGRVVSDVRVKLVDEAWFKRTTGAAAPERDMAAELGWTQDAPPPAPDAPEHGIDHDR